MKLNVYDTQTHNSHFYETNNVASIGAKIDSVVQYNQELYINCLKSLQSIIISCATVLFSPV